MGEPLEYVKFYKYLGYNVHEHLMHTDTVNTLTKNAKHAFGKIINVFYRLKDMSLCSYETLYKAKCALLCKLCQQAWGFREFQPPRTLQNRCSRFFPGMHIFTPMPAANTEMDVIDIRHARWVEVVRLTNRIIYMKPNHWPKLVLHWDTETHTSA